MIIKVKITTGSLSVINIYGFIEFSVMLKINIRFPIKINIISFSVTLFMILS